MHLQKLEDILLRGTVTGVVLQHPIKNVHVSFVWSFHSHWINDHFHSGFIRVADSIHSQTPGKTKYIVANNITPKNVKILFFMGHFQNTKWPTFLDKNDSMPSFETVQPKQ